MDEYTARQKPQRSELHWKYLPDGGILVRNRFSQPISLGPMGSDVFERCDGKTTVAEIVEGLLKDKSKYGHIPRRHIEHDVVTFLDWLQSLGVLLLYWDDF